MRAFLYPTREPKDEFPKDKYKAIRPNKEEPIRKESKRFVADRTRERSDKKCMRVNSKLPYFVCVESKKDESEDSESVKEDPDFYSPDTFR